MILKNVLFKNAASKVGIEQSDSEAIDGDLFRVCERVSQGICAELNNSKAFSFGEEVLDVSNTSSMIITIKPYTEDELALIEEAKTFVAPYTPEQQVKVDAHDMLVGDVNRITSIGIPIKPPIIQNYTLVSYRDLVMNATHDDVFAYNTKNDAAEIVFKRVVGSFRMLYTLPISLDDEPSGYVLIPSNYESFFTAKLAVGLAYYFQFHDTAKLLELETTRLGNMVADNNTVQRPILNNVASRLNKYRL